MRETLLKTEKLSKSFSNGGAMQHVLKNIDLELYRYHGCKRRGKIHAFVRPVWNGYAYPGNHYFRGSGDFQP